MGKLILSFGIVFSLFLALGQENRIFCGLTSSIDKSSFDFEPFWGINQKQKTNLAYNVGLRIQYNLNANLSLKSGVLYSKNEYKTDYIWGSLIDPIDPYIPKESNLKIGFLNIPLMIGFGIINKEKFRFTPSTGIISEFLVGSTETSLFGDNSKRDSEFIRQNLTAILFSAQINIGFEYHFERNAFLTFEPYLRFGLNRIADEILNSKPISYDSILSINYSWQK